MRLRTLSTALLLLAPASFVQGCALQTEDGENQTEGGENITTSSQDLWSRSGTVFWPSREIWVCFRSSTFTNSSWATWRSNVRLQAMEGITRHADIFFRGWVQCPASPNASWLQIYRDSSSNSDSFTIGYGSSENKIRFGNDSTSRAVVVHEFMHKLGFDHEFNRDDTDGCYTRQINGDGTEHTPYDTNSIMNSTGYCHGNADLSAYDIIGLQAVYGRKHAGSIVGQAGQCLNVQGGSSATGANLIAWPCVGGSGDTWNFRPDGLILANFSGTSRCANIQGGAVSPNGSTNLVTWSCSTADTNSLFSMQGVQWRAMGNMCVTATGTGTSSRLEVQACATNSSMQSWDFRVGSNRIRLSGTNKCVEVPNGSTALGTELTLRDCSTSSRQLFAFQEGEINFTSSRCLNVVGGDPTPGRRIALWDGCGSEYANEYFYVRGLIKGMGQCIDQLGGTAAEGNNVGVYPCSATAPNHQWDYHW